MMIPASFRALVSSGDGNGNNEIRIEELPISFLSQNEVLIQVTYSALNYKDALSAKGHKGITRNYPHVPGIDAAGIVLRDSSNRFKKGDSVLVTGYDLGMNTSGGFGSLISVPSFWVHEIPTNLSLKEAMILGTAGFTAALALYKCEQIGLKPSEIPVLVTGASGGVGSLAVMLLKKAGYSVIAVSGKKEKIDWLKSLGANEVLDRNEILDFSEKPLLSSQFSACIDTVGGKTLESVFKKLSKEAPIAVLGNVSGNSFSSSILPFLMRGNSLIGIDSAHIERETRIILWNKLSQEWKLDSLEKIAKEIPLEALPNEIEQILKGEQTGKILIHHTN